MSNKITFEFIADDGDIKQGFAKVEKQSKNTGRVVKRSLGGAFKSVGRGLKGLGSALTSFKGIAIGFVAALGVKRMLGSILNAAAVQEDAVNQLNSSLISTGKFSEATSKRLQDFASEMQDVTRFGDETTLSTMALIQSLGNLSEDGLKSATKATMDMASALKIDLQTAALLMGKAAAGETGSLSRYGLVVAKGATQAQTFANVLDAVNDKFGGAAQRDVQTYSGATEQLSAAYGDFLEVLGQSITQNEAVVEITKQLTGVFKEFGGYIQDNMPSIKNFMTDALNSLVNFAIKTAKAMKTVMTTLSDTVAGLRSFGLSFKSGMKVLGFSTRFLTDTLNNGFDAAKKNFKKNFAGVKEEFNEGLIGIFDDKAVVDRLSKLLDPVLDKAEEGAKKVKEIADTTRAATVGATKKVLDEEAKNVQNFKNKIDELSNSVKEKTADKMGEAADGIVKFKDRGKAAIKDISGQIETFAENTISGGVQNIVTALMTGENAFESFGRFVIGMMGDLAINIGNTIIGAAFAMEALQNFFSGPGIAIAAGIALVALGTILKTLSGGGGLTGTPSSAPTAPVSGGQPGQTGTFPAIEEGALEERGPQVTVNIQGNVLDRKESGLEIVKVLNQAFRDQGLKLQGTGVA